MRVTLVISSLVAGGAERCIAAMANYWAAKGWTVTLLTLASDSVPPFYPLHSAVRHRPLGVLGISANRVQAMLSNFNRVRKVRAAIRESAPDVVISLLSETNVVTLLATAGMSVPVIVQEQNDPAQQPIGAMWAKLRRWTYPRAAHVVVLTERSIGFFSPRIQKNARVIPNPALVEIAPRPPHTANGGGGTIIAMGRLVPQKGFDFLLNAFAPVAKKHPGWSLEILGDGPLRSMLETLAGSLGIRDRVRMPGTTREPHPKLQQADIFVMSSRYEGFPLSLCEAMACGLPVISFDCPTGPREIIRDGTDGLLVPAENVAALGDAMDSLVADTQRRANLAARAPEVMSRFGLPVIMEKWEAVIAECVAPEKLTARKD